MNIHTKDIELFTKLKEVTIYKSVIGSHLYENNTNISDIDYLSIYVPSKSELNTAFPSHHQIQYKDIENNIDYNFSNIFTFLKNLINGDSPVNFEIIHNTDLKNSSLNFLYDMRKDFYNYKILKSYLGIARKDLREMNKQSDFTKEKKKLSHAYRGLKFYEEILNGNLNIKMTDQLKNEIDHIKSLDKNKEYFDIIKETKEKIEEKRKELTDLYSSKKLIYPNFMLPQKQKELDEKLYEVISSDFWNKNKEWKLNMEIFYEINENIIIEYDL